MALIRMSKEADFTFQASGYNEDLRVVRCRGLEEVSRLFSFKIELAALDPAINFEAVVGKPGRLIFQYPQGRRLVHGRVLKFEQVREGKQFTYYEAHLVPLLWFLRFRHDCRIFQNKSVPEVIRLVLSQAGIPADQYRFALQKNYAPHSYLVQYRETDLNFICRLMEDEGLFFFFDHQQDKEVLVMGDSSVANVSIADQSTVPFREYSGLLQDEEFISQWRSGQRVDSGAVTLQDFNFTTPRLDLEVSEMAGDNNSLEIYDFPGDYEELDQGRRLARIRVETIRASRRLANGSSACRRFIPGFRFTLSRHPRSDFNCEYNLLRVVHEINQPQVAAQEAEEQDEQAPLYVNHFTCLRSNQIYHPPRVTRKPVIHGCQTAVVVGPQEEEIFTDEHGRVKVKFHWDRESKGDENSSCWIRVSQGWAGGRYGMMALPRIGQEVIVDFLEGDPDRPIITGRVYNGDLRPPYLLPDEKTKSTIKSNSSKSGDGYNELRFEDQAGQEQVFLHAQKDYDLRVENDRREWTGASRHLIVKKDKLEAVEGEVHTTVNGQAATRIEGDSSLTIQGRSLELIGGDASLTIQGQSSTAIKGGRSTTISGDAVTGCAANYQVSAGQEIHLRAGTKVVIDGGLELTIKAAGGFIKIDPMGVTITGNLVLINSGGAPGIGLPGLIQVPKSPLTPTLPDLADDGAGGRDKLAEAKPKTKTTPDYSEPSFQELPSPAAEQMAQAGALKKAAQTGAPFCATCSKA
ncbi:MAG: type VI secretion system tip protein VgrG [Deltaproteobacteria bacterium]|nr:type VI secretion system tip protein VgrG [Deltaproteobacteria bacterium]